MRKLNQTILTLLVATAAVTTPVWAIEKRSQNTSVPTVHNGATMAVIQKTLDKLAASLPFMKELPIQEIEITDKQDVVIIERKKEATKSLPQMTIYLDKESGEVQGFLLEEEVPEKVEIPLEVQKEKGEAFLKIMFGQEHEYRFDERRSKDIGDAIFTKMVKGVPFQDVSVFIGVNSRGEVVSFTNNGGKAASLDPSIFSEPSAAISLEQAEKALAGMMKPIYYLNGDDKVPTLTYQVIWSGYMDAKTGASIDTEHRKFSNPMDQLGTSIPVKPANQKLIVKNKDEGLSLLKNVFSFDSTGVTFLGEQQSERPGNWKEYKWQNGKQRGIVLVDKKDGRVGEVGIEDLSENQVSKKVTREEAQKIAVTLLQTYLTPDCKMLVLGPSDDNSDSLYTFQFYRTVNNIPIENQTYLVTIHSGTGKPMDLGGSFGTFARPQGDFPDPAKAVSIEQAAREYLKYHPLTLTYFLPVNNEKKADTPILAYKPQLNSKVSNRIDAFTGQIIK